MRSLSHRLGWAGAGVQPDSSTTGLRVIFTTKHLETFLVTHRGNHSFFYRQVATRALGVKQARLFCGKDHTASRYSVLSIHGGGIEKNWGSS